MESKCKTKLVIYRRKVAANDKEFFYVGGYQFVERKLMNHLISINNDKNTSVLVI